MYNFVYHVTNECFKTYTMKKTLEGIVKKRKSTEVPENKEENPCTTTRAKTSPREPPSAAKPVWKTVCVVCGRQKTKDGEYDKFRISESDRAELFLQATVYLQDDVYTRTCDLQDVYAVFGADLYCHKNCIRSYLKKYERAEENDTANPQTEKQLAFKKMIGGILH